MLPAELRLGRREHPVLRPSAACRMRALTSFGFTYCRAQGHLVEYAGRLSRAAPHVLGCRSGVSYRHAGRERLLRRAGRLAVERPKRHRDWPGLAVDAPNYALPNYALAVSILPAPARRFAATSESGARLRAPRSSAGLLGEIRCGHASPHYPPGVAAHRRE